MSKVLITKPEAETQMLAFYNFIITLHKICKKQNKKELEKDRQCDQCGKPGHLNFSFLNNAGRIYRKKVSCMLFYLDVALF